VLWREYKGQTLDEDQIRELLQRRVLLEPVTIEGAGAVVLQLMDSGDLAEIPVPTGGPRRFGAKPTRGSRTSRRAPGRRTARVGDEGDSATPPTDGAAGPKARRPKASNPREAGSTPAKTGDGFGAAALGSCPLCGSAVVEQEKSFGCSGWRQGCKFAIWKTIAGKSIGVRTAQALLRQGRTPLLRGFRSKAGNRFEARLKLDGGEVRFDFDPDDRHRPPGSADTV
jgi:DNA topoisomerase-3